MKVSYGEVELNDKIDSKRIVIDVHNGAGDSRGVRRSAWAYLTKSQARKIAQRLMKFADK